MHQVGKSGPTAATLLEQFELQGKILRMLAREYWETLRTRARHRPRRGNASRFPVRRAVLRMARLALTVLSDTVREIV